jgi:hypothetical protein
VNRDEEPIAEEDGERPAVVHDGQEAWSGNERRRPRSSFVERIGKARARRRSDRDTRGEQEQPNEATE